MTDRTHPDSGERASPGVVPELRAEIERLRAELSRVDAMIDEMRDSLDIAYAKGQKDGVMTDKKLRDAFVALETERDELRDGLASALHYPDCWDTAVVSDGSECATRSNRVVPLYGMHTAERTKLAAN